MKKLVALFVCLFALISVAQADNDKAIRKDQLPTMAQQFIQQHFADNKVAIAKVENDLFSKSYDVIFANGNKVEFDQKGVWKEVDCKYSQVPLALIPDAIRKYVTANYPDAKVVQIERDKKDYEVKLSGGLELKFDLKFNLIDFDKK